MTDEEQYLLSKSIVELTSESEITDAEVVEILISATLMALTTRELCPGCYTSLFVAATATVAHELGLDFDEFQHYDGETNDIDVITENIPSKLKH